jgi:hypothetical protein
MRQTPCDKHVSITDAQCPIRDTSTSSRITACLGKADCLASFVNFVWLKLSWGMWTRMVQQSVECQQQDASETDDDHDLIISLDSYWNNPLYTPGGRTTVLGKSHSPCSAASLARFKLRNLRRDLCEHVPASYTVINQRSKDYHIAIPTWISITL